MGRKARGGMGASEHHHSLSTAAKAGTVLGLGHTAPSFCAGEKPLQQHQHQLWLLKWDCWRHQTSGGPSEETTLQ